MTRARAAVQLAGAVQALLALTVIWMALGASNVYPLDIPVGRVVRWVALGGLALATLGLAALAPRVRLARLAPLVPAALLLAVALASVLWSPDAGLTLRRTLTLAALFGAGAGLAVVARDERGRDLVLAGILAGAAAIALGSLVELALEPDDAIVPATRGQGARYQGLGQNPNTLAMLFAVALPLAVWAAVAGATRRRRGLALGLAGLLNLSIVASGSRGAIVAAIAGAAVVLLVAVPRRALLVLGAAAALTAVELAATQLPPRAERDPVIAPEFGSLVPEPVSPNDVSARLPLGNEIGLPPLGTPAGTRTLLSGGGRTAAWRGAFDQYAERPLAGYGFGTEELVFVDRYNLFLSDRVENSYLATLLQLGPFGLGLLVAAAGVPVALWLRRGVRRHGLAVAACAGAVVAGALLALTQSFVTSVGSPPTVPFWVAAFVLAAARPERDERERDEREEDAA